MRKILFFVTLVISFSVYSDPLIVFRTNLEINSECKIKATNQDGKIKLVKLSLPESTKCKFILYDETNLIHTEQISKYYIFLVELTSNTKYGCMSEHTAFAIKTDGSIISANFSKKSLTCNIDREKKLFHHFAHEMKILS